jgi:hypothetical protein
MWYQPTVTCPEASEGELVPGPRAAHSCNLIGNRMIVFGGWNGKKGLNDLHVLDIDKMEWCVHGLWLTFVPADARFESVLCY